VVWAAACVAAAASGLDNGENAPILAKRWDCATQFDEWLAPMRPLLPDRGVVGYAGPERDAACHPMFVAQYTLAPVYVVEVSPEHRNDLAKRRVHLLPNDPPLVIVWGEEGQRWLDGSPAYHTLLRVTDHILLVSREP
jgi:hypothetical protein